jgi:hypothetical protein
MPHYASSPTLAGSLRLMRVSQEPAQPFDHVVGRELTARRCWVVQHELMREGWRKLYTREPISTSSSGPFVLDDGPADL